MDEATHKLYTERGLGARQGAGTRPALVVVDLNRGFTDPASPLHCDTDDAVEATARLLEAARASGCPVAFTTISYDESGKRVAKSFIDKVPSLLTLAADSPWPEIDRRISPLPGEPVLNKLYASAFFGTPFASLLATTPTSAVDGMQYGYKVVVPREAVADRATAPHEANLFDIDAKYGDVVSTEEALDLLRSATFAETATAYGVT